MHEGMNAVIAGIGGETEVGDDEPLRCQVVVVVCWGFSSPCDHDIDAGRQSADGFPDRKGRSDVSVECLFDVHLTFPDRDAALLGEPSDVKAIKAALEIPADHTRKKIAVANTVNLDRHRTGVDADDGNATLAGPRQHI